MLVPVNEPNKYDYRDLQHQLDIAKSKVFMGTDSAFFAPVMCSQEFVWSEGLPTAGTDGKTFWWNPKDFLRCDIKERLSTIMHELWHIVLLHNLRRGARDNMIWNHACDYYINRNLRIKGYLVPKEWLDDKNLDHFKCEEDIYDHLFKNHVHVIGGHCQHNHEDLEQEEEDPNTAIDITVAGITNAKMEGQPSSIPGDVEELVDRFLSPIIPWEQYLLRWMSELMNHDYSWMTRDRRYQHIYMPGEVEDDGRLEHLVYFQDVSGSITNQEIVRFNSELKYVWEEFRPKRMTIVQFDTIIQKIDEFKEGDEFAEIVIKGRGGTCLRCVRQWIIDNRPTAAIIFSDMQVVPMEKLPIEIPVLWVASNARGVSVPFGELIHIKV